MERICLVLLLLVAVFSVVGCGKFYVEDPETGELLLKEDVSKRIDTVIAVGETVSSLGPLISAWWAPAAGIAAFIAGLVGTAKVYKPKLEQAEQESELYYDATKATVAAIEQFKAAHPDVWEEHLGPLLQKYHGERTQIEAVIRALLDLPPRA